MYDYTTSSIKTIKHNKTLPILIFTASLYPLYYLVFVESSSYNQSESSSYFNFLMNDFAGRMLLLIIFLAALGYLIFALMRKNKVIENELQYKFYTKEDNLYSTLYVEKFETTKQGRKKIEENKSDHILIPSISKIEELIEKKVSYNQTSTKTGLNLNDVTGKVDRNLDNPVGVYKTTSKGSYMQKQAVYKDGTTKVISTSIPLEELKKYI